MIGHLGYITLASREPDKAVQFYESVFDWKLARSEETAHFFELSNVTVAIIDVEQLVAFTNSQAFSATAGNTTLLSWNVPDRDAVCQLMQRSKANHATIQREPCELPWGSFAGIMRTPDGHMWEIVWNPKHP